MSKKPKRGAPAIDMTAMVDVAFLLLTFFILTTTKFREESVVEIDTPSSVSTTSVPETELMTLEIDRDGRVFIGFSDIDIREEALQIAASTDEKNLQLNNATMAQFSSSQNFGVPFRIMQQWINLSKEEKLEFVQPGLSAATDSTGTVNNDVKDWVRFGRLAVARRNMSLPNDQKKRMRFAIKADGEAGYDVISNVISTLQDWKINQFSLITALEDRPEEYAGAEGEDERVGF